MIIIIIIIVIIIILKTTITVHLSQNLMSSIFWQLLTRILQLLLQHLDSHGPVSVDRFQHLFRIMK